LISLPTYNQGETDLTDEYITSDFYAVFARDTFTVTSEEPDPDLMGLFGVNKDTFEISAVAQGNHSLSLVRVEHDVYDTDTFTIDSVVAQGNHALTVVRVEHDVYDTDTFTIDSVVAQGNHALTVVRVDHDVYDTDTFTVTAAAQGNHTLG
jgi:hypothetical protein